MSGKLFFLVDCNNFYVSCERVFRPDLENRPVVVLSNNDGCVISRSDEVKALGVEMATPFFKVRNILEKHRVTVFSSNYTLYAELSRRFGECLKRFSPDIETYSIDEAFLAISGLDSKRAFALGSDIRNTIKRWIGIPVGVGIAPTKTLAKLANRVAKKETRLGVHDLTDPGEREVWLRKTSVNNIWGIADRWALRLVKLGVTTAWDLAQIDPRRVRNCLNVIGERTARELRGEEIFDLELPADKKSVVSSRSFSRPVTVLSEIEAAVADHAARAAEKIRIQDLIAGALVVTVDTKSFSKGERHHSDSAFTDLMPPTCDTGILTGCAKACARQIFKSGFNYRKVAVMLFDLAKSGSRQQDLFGDVIRVERKENLMHVMDQLNRRYGQNTMFMAAQGVKRDWSMRRNRLSIGSLTCWNSLPTVQ